MSWKIKQKPEDFIVREVIFDRTEESWKEKMRRIRGHVTEKNEKYLWFTLKKTDKDFFRIIAQLGRELGVSTKEIGYSGTKDKKAVTYQTISVPIEKEEEVREMELPGVEISDLRSRNRPIKLGEHQGNDFEITVRNVSESEGSLSKMIKRVKKEGVINYFGEQRFGSVSGLNDAIGKMLVFEDLRNAAAYMMEGGGDYEKRMSAYLKRKPGDVKGAIRQLPLRMVKIFVHAYQAKLWNECAKRYEGGNTAIPLIGHKTDLKAYPKVRGIVEEVLDEEKLEAGDFKIWDFKELSSRGTERDYMVIPEKLEYSLKGKVLKLKFYLPKGSYATEVVRQLKNA